MVCRTKWKRKAHINELEGAALLMAVKHLGRSSLRRGQKVLMLSDSLVVVGAVSKGRSSSWRVNSYCRRIAAHLMFWGPRLYLRYINTRVNPADGPSRGGRIGVANDRLKKKRP